MVASVDGFLADRILPKMAMQFVAKEGKKSTQRGGK